MVSQTLSLLTGFPFCYSNTFKEIRSPLNSHRHLRNKNPVKIADVVTHKMVISRKRNRLHRTLNYSFLLKENIKTLYCRRFHYTKTFTVMGILNECFPVLHKQFWVVTQVFDTRTHKISLKDPQFHIYSIVSLPCSVINRSLNVYRVNKQRRSDQELFMYYKGSFQGRFV